MKFYSTRSKSKQSHENDIGFLEAVRTGLAPDGGLYLPREWPHFSGADFSSIDFGSPDSFAEFSARLLTPFLEDDFSAGQIASITRQAFSFPLPVKSLASGPSLLELFHGPTAAFKDFGARFLSQVLAHAPKSSSETDAKRSCVLVATSGDTGAAVAAAFYNQPGIEVFVLYPKGRVSSRQEKQLTAWGGNVRSFQVDGSFDDCQRLVKEAFQSQELAEETKIEWISANSINLGRWLPQVCAFAYVSMKHQQETGREVSFAVPTGNLGNGLAAMVARKMGFPIHEIILASNSNHSVTDFFHTGKFTPHTSIATLANAMDIGNPSNMERLQAIWPNAKELSSWVHAVSVSDAEILGQIEKTYQETGEVICPHTATAIFAVEAEHFAAEHFVKDTLAHWIAAATAHPAKFPEVTSKHAAVKIPEELQKLLERPSHSETLAPKFDDFVKKLTSFGNESVCIV